MWVILLAGLGLCMGSFINAWVWRLRQQASQKSKVKSQKYSIWGGRSVCPNCHHQLNALDLVPVLSWLVLRAKCRYCHQLISAQYPLTELLTAILFVASYLAWSFSGYISVIGFGIWLIELVCLVSLAVYDLKHMLLPDKIMRILMILAVADVGVVSLLYGDGWLAFNHALAAVLGGGFFYGLYGISKGKWMGGGDVKLAFAMGLLLGTRGLIVAMFLGFNAAALMSVGLMIARRLSRKDLIPFGPFLIAGTIMSMLFSSVLIGWYLRLVNLS